MSVYGPLKLSTSFPATCHHSAPAFTQHSAGRHVQTLVEKFEFRADIALPFCDKENEYLSAVVALVIKHYLNRVVGKY